MEAGVEFDALVAAKVMGLDVHEVGEPVYEGYGSVGERTVCVVKEGDTFSEDIPCYSTDIAAARQVLKRMQELGWVRLEVEISGEHARATFRQLVGSGVEQASGATAPLAICLAALKAVGHRIQTAVSGT